MKVKQTWFVSWRYELVVLYNQNLILIFVLCFVSSLAMLAVLVLKYRRFPFSIVFFLFVEFYFDESRQSNRHVLVLCWHLMIILSVIILCKRGTFCSHQISSISHTVLNCLSITHIIAIIALCFCVLFSVADIALQFVSVCGLAENTWMKVSYKLKSGIQNYLIKKILKLACKVTILSRFLVKIILWFM